MAVKRARTGPPQPEDLYKGAVVLYDEDQRGVIDEAFAPLDQFWVKDEQTKDLIRDAEGNIIAFSSSQLLLAPSPDKPTGEQAPACARVLLIGTEQQMLQILEQFGAPDATERRDPQQLLAVPCTSCKCGPACARFDPVKRSMCNSDECPLLQLAAEGIDEAMQSLARRLRPDIFTDVRPFHLKQAVEQIGPDIKLLDGYYCLSAVTLPFSQKTIAKSTGWEKYWMEEVRCQIDLGVSSEGIQETGESSLEDTAKRALGEACGLCLSDYIWSDDAQFKVRKKLGVDMPVKFWDGPETKVFVLLIPDDAKCSSEKGLLMFSEAAPEAAAPKSAKAEQPGPGGKTIAEWKADQAQFRDLPKLPEGWIRIRSRTNPKEIYYFDTRKNKPSNELPLPEGWTKEKSKTTGKAYYFNARKRKSSFEYPTE